MTPIAASSGRSGKWGQRQPVVTKPVVNKSDKKRIRGGFHVKNTISLAAGVFLLLAGSLAAQTPQTSSGVPDESFLAEQFCFETQFSNSGAVGYGPYLRIELVDGLTLDSVEIFGTGGTLIDAGAFRRSEARRGGGAVR